MTDIKPGDTVDVTIKGVEFTYERTIDHSAGAFSIRDEHGRRYTMPPQAAMTRPGQQDATDTATLQERISNAIRVIDNMADEQTLSPDTAYWFRKLLDPYPRHWPPQAGDVWDDGMPFGGSLWFARQYTEDGQRRIVMTFVEGGGNTKSPEELFEESPGPLKRVYRPENGTW